MWFKAGDLSGGFNPQRTHFGAEAASSKLFIHNTGYVDPFPNQNWGNGGPWSTGVGGYPGNKWFKRPNAVEPQPVNRIPA